MKKKRDKILLRIAKFYDQFHIVFESYIHVHVHKLTHGYCFSISINDLDGDLNVSLRSLAALLKLSVLQCHINVIANIT